MSVEEPPLRIHLSPPDVGPAEREALLRAFDSNWIAPLGPEVDAFEAEVAAHVDRRHAVALSSGTAALHLALVLSGIGPGDRVLCPTLTFVASANPVRYVGATPVFVDSAPGSWNLDVDLVAEQLADGAANGRPYAAVVAVDLYGRCCDYAALEPVCAEYGVPLIEDAAEALGSRRQGRAAGAFGELGVLSFNGNKVMTTSGGGMLLSDDGDVAAEARYLATQARDPAPHYEHSRLGYNYRMSNLLAGLGRAQLASLDDKVAARRRIGDRYRGELADLPGVAFLDDAPDEVSNQWLTCLTIDPARSGVDREQVRRELRRAGIEARPVWKPMHRQPLYRDEAMIGGRVADRLFDHGLCLPSGSTLTPSEQAEICQRIREVLRA